MKGKNVYIRVLEEKDLEKNTSWMNNPEISEIMGYLPTKNLLNQRKWFESISIDNSRFIFAICLLENDEHIGNVGLGNIDYISRHCMLNIFIASDKDRQKGIGTEATKLVLDFAFMKLNMNKVHLRTSENNILANKMYSNLGFSKEGVLRQHYFTEGKYENKIIYSILRSEYIIYEK